MANIVRDFLTGELYASEWNVSNAESYDVDGTNGFTSPLGNTDDRTTIGWKALSTAIDSISKVKVSIQGSATSANAKLRIYQEFTDVEITNPQGHGVGFLLSYSAGTFYLNTHGAGTATIASAVHTLSTNEVVELRVTKNGPGTPENYTLTALVDGTPLSGMNGISVDTDVGTPLDGYTYSVLHVRTYNYDDTNLIGVKDIDVNNLTEVGPVYSGSATYEDKLGDDYSVATGTPIDLTQWFTGEGTLVFNAVGNTLPTGCTMDAPNQQVIGSPTVSNLSLAAEILVQDDRGYEITGQFVWATDAYHINFDAAAPVEDINGTPYEDATGGIAYSVFSGQIGDGMGAEVKGDSGLTMTGGILNIQLPDTETSAGTYTVAVIDSDESGLIPLGAYERTSA